MKKAVFFDLFFTLANLEYQSENEFTLLNISRKEWEASAENADVYRLRATGKPKTERHMLESMVNGLPFSVNENQLKRLIEIRNDRYRKSLTDIHPDIFFTLKQLKDSGIKLCLVSNADIIDKKYWDISPLKDYFDAVICGDMVSKSKPEPDIFIKACEELGVKTNEAYAIEDSHNGIKAASRGGLRPIMVPDLMPVNQEMKELSLDILDSLLEVKTYLENLSH